MRMACIARFLEFVGDYLPGVHELTLLVPAFFGLYSAARALGLDVDLGPEAAVVISVTFSCFVWIILNSLTFRETGPLGETTHGSSRRRSSRIAGRWSQPVDRDAGSQPKKERTSPDIQPSHGESSHQGRQYRAGLR